jgi:hypothetical protein
MATPAKNVKVSPYRWWWEVEWQEPLPKGGRGDFSLLFRLKGHAESFANALRSGDRPGSDYWVAHRLDRR